MSSELNKPTGLGYQSNLQRECAECHHREIKHYGHRCYEGIDGGGALDDEIVICECLGFTVRELDELERRVLAEQAESELEYVGEVITREIRREALRRG